MSTEKLLEHLPTGKPHISFSELKEWKDCSFRHNLRHVKKIDLSKPTNFFDFGTAVHLSCEEFLKTRVMDTEIAMKFLDEAWEKNKGIEGYSPAELLKAKEDALKILNEVPAFMDREFPDWQFIAAEEELYESIDNQPHAFKGFIDGVVKAKGKKGEDLVWLLDWKTSNRGWMRQKRQDPMTKTQLVLYKSYWTQKHNIDLKNVRCAFVILKKSAKAGDHCESFPVSVGEIVIKRTLKMVNDMVVSVKRGVSIKNRDSCQYCDYKGTEYCL